MKKCKCSACEDRRSEDTLIVQIVTDNRMEIGNLCNAIKERLEQDSVLLTFNSQETVFI